MRQRSRLKSVFIFSVWFGVTCRVLLGAEESADTTAKFLAGLAVPATAVDTPDTTSPWAAHSRELDRAWKRTEQQQLPAIANWAPDFLAPNYRGGGTMFYMFSGPDFLYAH